MVQFDGFSTGLLGHGGASLVVLFAEKIAVGYSEDWFFRS